MTVAAFDLSLTATGCALADSDQWTGLGVPRIHVSRIIPPRNLAGCARLDYIVREVLRRADAESILFEELAFGANDPGAQERSGLAWIIRHQLWMKQVSWITVAPARLKKWATGAGNAKKDEVMLAVYKRFGVDTESSDEADAAALAALGLALAGKWRLPLTKTQIEVLEAIRRNEEPRKNRKHA